MQIHFPALGNFSRFFEIGLGWGKFILRSIEGGSCEKSPRQIVLCSSFPQAGHGLLQIISGLLKTSPFIPLRRGNGLCLQQKGAAEGELVQGDVEKPFLSSYPSQSLTGSFLHLPNLPLTQKQIAEAKTSNGV